MEKPWILAILAKRKPLIKPVKWQITSQGDLAVSFGNDIARPKALTLVLARDPKTRYTKLRYE